MRFRSSILVALALVAFGAAHLAAQPILNAGSQTPFKLNRTPGGNFLLAEAGTGANDGRVSLLSIWGDRFNLIGGLPSGRTPQGENALGPTAVADAHSTLYIVIGEGDVMGPSTTPPAQVPNPNGLSSPIFSSIIRARFSPVPDGIRTGFQLTAANINALADGREITLDNSAGERVQLLVLADFPDILPDPFIRVRNSNPFAAKVAGTLTAEDLTELGFQGVPLTSANHYARLNWDTPIGRRLEERSRIYVVNAGMNTVTEVAAATGRWRVITRFAPVSNPLFPGLGGPVADPVPTGLFVREDGTLLVTILAGFPFVPGSAKVYSVNPLNGVATPLIEGLTSATEVVEVGNAIYVLELSTDQRMGAPGRLLRFTFPLGAPTVVATGLIGPTGLAHETTRNELLVSETFTGLIKRIALTP